MLEGHGNSFCEEPDSKYFRLCRPRGKIEDVERYLHNKREKNINELTIENI